MKKDKYKKRTNKRVKTRKIKIRKKTYSRRYEKNKRSKKYERRKKGHIGKTSKKRSYKRIKNNGGGGLPGCLSGCYNGKRGLHHKHCPHYKVCKMHWDKPRSASFTEETINGIEGRALDEGWIQHENIGAETSLDFDKDIHWWNKYTGMSANNDSLTVEVLDESIIRRKIMEANNWKLYVDEESNDWWFTNNNPPSVAMKPRPYFRVPRTTFSWDEVLASCNMEKVETLEDDVKRRMMKQRMEILDIKLHFPRKAPESTIVEPEPVPEPNLNYLDRLSPIGRQKIRSSGSFSAYAIGNWNTDNGAGDRDLHFKIGDEITVQEILGNGQWKGEKNGKSGVFPVILVDPQSTVTELVSFYPPEQDQEDVWAALAAQLQEQRRRRIDDGTLSQSSLSSGEF